MLGPLKTMLHRLRGALGLPEPKRSLDLTPWRHPYLTGENLRRFRRYSESVWRIALERARLAPQRRLRAAFCVNLAQNMHKWARLAKKYGADATLYPHAQDGSALNCPEWEEFDGEFPNPLDGERFLREHPDIEIGLPCERIPMDDRGLHQQYEDFLLGDRKGLLRSLAESPEIRHEILLAYQGLWPYFSWARELSRFDVICAASSPLAAYACGRPYCAVPVGGDLQFDCGRSDDYGRVMLLSFNAARFLMVSNPHMAGHCRRLGLTNGVYLPYAMDTDRYCPGKGRFRGEWEREYGSGVYVFSPSRLDREVKGQGRPLLDQLFSLARERPELRFVFLAWGNSTEEFRGEVARAGMGRRFILLPPVGKKRLTDYYRSCDIVLDHFVYGYYGSTALEAAAIEKPVVMKIREEHYAPLYAGDVAPVENASTPEEVARAVDRLATDAEYRAAQGRRMREWVVRNHGEERTVPLMLALLGLTADRTPLPRDLVNPLLDEESEEERAYHEACLVTPHD